ncbi:MAG TPA: pentapeptide repeat-containing protein [Solirubrobacterales bacterium]|nr:pentapeptide repeat-containing protein [Solirubrobacterales bacterium]
MTAVTLLAVAPAAASAKPFVSVQATLTPTGSGAEVDAHVEWDAEAAQQSPGPMIVGNLSLVAVSDDGHHPKLLDQEQTESIATEPTQHVTLHVSEADIDAIAPGNRVVLTASQHGLAPGSTRSAKTFVTVDQLQPFAGKQDRIGRRDCSEVAVTPGANLQQCDLVGAYLNRAQVSQRKIATNMRIADLTGAKMEGADLGGLNVAGGRLNGVMATGAIFDNVYIAGAEASRLDAEHAKITDETGGANMYDARLEGANFQGSRMNGTSVDRADLAGADFRNATWNAIEASTTKFRGADLRGFKSATPHISLADFTDAKLKGTGFTDAELKWATLCHTEMPSGAIEDRDCSDKSDPGPPPVADPKVAVKATLTRSQGEVTIRATVDWNMLMIGSMSLGDIRILAIDGKTGLPKLIARKEIKENLASETSFEWKFEDTATLNDLAAGNRVVLTATQHRPPGRGETTKGSFVTVATLQRGPGRGQVGSRDCSNLTIGPEAAEGALDYCDLTGAVLNRATLGGFMRKVDLTGAELQNAELQKGLTLDGSTLAGVNAEGAKLKNVMMSVATAPHVNLSETLIENSKMEGDDLDAANFEVASITDSHFAASSLRKALFTGATFLKVDLAFTDLDGGHLDEIESRKGATSLFLADLTDATLAKSKFAPSEEGEIPWQMATLCHTKLPEGAEPIGDRDCPY